MLRQKKFAKDKKQLDQFWKRALRGTNKWFRLDETRAIIIPIHVTGHWICAFIDLITTISLFLIL
ncbi:hypothetical protein K438DRAFT_1829624 [Mycena galopus ATCC 62051]|nr:hypothetical protein K438DRAFT_1829624 [Mycena galopus ATCC 62051]